MSITEAEYYKLHGAAHAAELTPLIRANAAELLRRCNALLALAAADGVVAGIDAISGNEVASGWRPLSVNARTSNASTTSTHLTGEGIDVQDMQSRALAAWCCRNTAALAKLGLWMECPRWTAGKTRSDPWVHLQSRAPRSGQRIYVPSTAPAQDPDFYLRNGIKQP